MKNLNKHSSGYYIMCYWDIKDGFIIIFNILYFTGKD